MDPSRSFIGKYCWTLWTLGSYIQFLLACGFFSPSSPACFTCLWALLQAHWFSDFSRQAAVSFHAGLIWLAAQPRSGDRQLHLQELAQPSTPAAHGGPRAYQHSSYPRGACAQGSAAASQPAGGPTGWRRCRCHPRQWHSPQGQLAKSCDQPHQAWQCNHRLSTCFTRPGGAGGDSLRLQSDRLNANYGTLTSEPGCIHSTGFYHCCLN